jgi:hypothetical protein
MMRTRVVAVWGVAAPLLPKRSRVVVRASIATAAAVGKKTPAAHVSLHRRRHARCPTLRTRRHRRWHARCALTCCSEIAVGVMDAAAVAVVVAAFAHAEGQDAALRRRTRTDARSRGAVVAAAADAAATADRLPPHPCLPLPRLPCCRCHCGFRHGAARRRRRPPTWRRRRRRTTPRRAVAGPRCLRAAPRVAAWTRLPPCLLARWWPVRLWPPSCQSDETAAAVHPPAVRFGSVRGGGGVSHAVTAATPSHTPRTRTTPRTHRD